MSKFKGGTKVKIIETGSYRGVRYEKGEIWIVIDSDCKDHIMVSRSGEREENYTLLAHDEYELYVEQPITFGKQLEQLNADVILAQACLDRALVNLQGVKKLMEFFKEG